MMTSKGATGEIAKRASVAEGLVRKSKRSGSVNAQIDLDFAVRFHCFGKCQTKTYLF